MNKEFLNRIQNSKDELESLAMRVSRSKQSFDDDFFDSYKVILGGVDSLFSEKTYNGPEWLNRFKGNYYKQTLGLFHCFLDSCEVLRNYNVACSILRSIADRLGIISLLFLCTDNAERELRCLLFLLDTLDDALQLQMNDDALMNKFSSKKYLSERESFLKDKIESCKELISKNKLILDNFSLDKVIKYMNWRYKDSPDKCKPRYSYEELYEFIPCTQIPGIANHYKWLSQNVHGLYSSILELPVDSPASYHVPMIYGINLLCCFRNILKMPSSV